ncbi:MAG: YkgJ family cysteine cluster protein [Candidatus Sulfotelmatobacter sp.]
MASSSTRPLGSERNVPRAAPGLVQLERQVERGNLFAHTALEENAVRLGELEIPIHSLTDTPLAKGVVSESEITSAMSEVDAELRQRKELAGVRTMVRMEKGNAQAEAAVEVDCSARLHICHAACCRMDFALSVEEVEGGKIKWDLGRPYFIRRERNGCCTHLGAGSQACRVYGDRPGVCRGYSCAKDTRIWNDFDNMVLNQEWIDANLGRAPEPHAMAALMDERDCLTEPSATQEKSRDGRS